MLVWRDSVSFYVPVKRSTQIKRFKPHFSSSSNTLKQSQTHMQAHEANVPKDADECVCILTLSKKNDLLRPNVTQLLLQHAAFPTTFLNSLQTFLHNVTGICSVVVSLAEKQFKVRWKLKGQIPLKVRKRREAVTWNSVFHTCDCFIVKVRRKQQERNSQRKQILEINTSAVICRWLKHSRKKVS